MCRSSRLGKKFYPATNMTKLKITANGADPNTFYSRPGTCDFMCPERIYSQDVKLTKLTNDMHPIFGQCLKQAVPKYSVVEESARLASRFIECGALDHIYLTIANEGKPGNSWRSRVSASQVGLEILLETADEKVPADKSKVQELLETLHNSVKYTLDHTILADAMMDACRGKDFLHPSFPHAEGGVIRILCMTGLRKLRNCQTRSVCSNCSFS